ncbi:MAG: sulfotransferase [Shimia sp.]
MNGAGVLYCVGATKAGTSWLYAYLRAHPECAVLPVKELHFWDTEDDERAQVMSGRLRSQHKALADAVAYRDTRAYIAVLTEGAGDKLCADITPSYSLLSEDRLSEMLDAAPSAKVLFLMRDPVARHWSHVRMQAVRNARPAIETPELAARIMQRSVTGGERHITARGDYAAICEKLRAVVPEGQLMLAFMEDMLTAEGLADICAFLGIAALPGPIETRVHGGEPIKMKDRHARAAREMLAPQYDYTERLMGRLPDAWTVTRAVA